MPDTQNIINSKKIGWLIIVVLCLIKLAIHLYANGHYGFHRDELLHLAAGDHLAWGYMEFPPMIGWLGKLERLLFGESLLAVRLFPALVGTALVLLSALITKELGGKNPAILLSGVCVLAAHAYYRNHTLFQPVAFDQLAWTLGFFYLIRHINTQEKKYIFYFAIVMALGFLNKYSILFYLGGIGIAILFTKNRKWLSQKYWWQATGLGVLIILPNLIWQWSYDFPVLDHFSELYNAQLNERSRMDFLQGQFFSMNPFNFPIWFGALFFLLLSPTMKTYRFFAWAFLGSLALFLLANGKHYYLFGIYPMFFAAGAVASEKLLNNKWILLIPVYAAFLLYSGFIRVPYGTPFLDIEAFVAYAGLERNEAGYQEGLTGDYADMFGWPEQVALIDSVYKSLSPEEQGQCLIWAENYGEAGAVQHFGKQYGLPAPTSKHGSFWIWGPGKRSGEVVISIGNETDDVNYFFEDVKLIKRIQHPYAIEEEQNIPLYLCKKPKITLHDYWPEWRDNIFD